MRQGVSAGLNRSPSMTSLPEARKNLLLRALPDDVLSRLLPALQPIPITLRQVLHEADSKMDAAYFLTSGRASLILGLGDGSQSEVGIVGYEGMVGLPLICGQNSFAEAMVQGTGVALRMEATAFQLAFEDDPVFRQVLLRYADVMQAQVM